MEQWVNKLFSEEVKKKAIHFFHKENTTLEVVRNFENFVLQYEKDDKWYILRLTHSSHRSYEQVCGEVEFIEHLANGGANVIEPIRSKNGKLVEKIEAKDGSEFFVISYKKAEGEFVSHEKRTPEFLQLWGKTVGQMHRLSLSFTPSKPEFRRIEWYEDDLYLPENNIPDSEHVIRDKYIDLLKHIKSLPKEKDSYGLIHSDVHLGNLVLNGSRIRVFDFDDAMHQYFISDIAILFYYATQRWNLYGEERAALNERANMMLPPLLKGYRKEFQLDEKWMEEIKTFIRLRDFALFSLFHKKMDSTNEVRNKRLEEIGNRLRNCVDLLTIDFTLF